MMYDWLNDPVTLPRWVVWSALLTSPAMWTRHIISIVRQKISDNKTQNNGN